MAPVLALLLTGCVTANMWAYGEPKSKWAKAAWTPLTLTADLTVIGCAIGSQSLLENMGSSIAAASVCGNR